MTRQDRDYLYKSIESFVDAGFISIDDLPPYIINNLSPMIKLRDYQKEAFNYFFNYDTNEKLRKNKQMHLLFHMATGSGKTVIMAGLILYLYKQGYRNFVFFVDTNNIIEKTKLNFLDKSASKYLFNEKIIIDGEEIVIKEVSNFQDNDSDFNSINMKFTTIQKLHDDLNKAKENNLTISDFEDNKVVLIADEAHHINSETKKKLDKKEEAFKESWEYSVRKVFEANKDNVLLEFTATADLKHKAIADKYADKIIYDYPLLKFRESGYTKEFNNFQSTYDELHRVIVAMLLSQYRLKLFEKHGLSKKPAILLKSKTIKESKTFYEHFHHFMENEITSSVIDKIFAESTDGIMKIMVDYFNANEITSNQLVQELKSSFAETHTIIMNSKDDASAENQKIVNELEDLSNPIRMIFTVDMLNEGWDVLNLYDIVRLYETRQGGNKISKTTISEAQLIGRGARYYPFSISEFDEKFKRKYDHEPDHEMRFCETLLYHSKQDSKYIQELREALKEIGFDPQEVIEFEYKLKDNFKETDTFKAGKLFRNGRVKKDRSVINALPSKFKGDVSVDLSFGYREVSLASTDSISTSHNEVERHKFSVSEIANQFPHVAFKAVRQFPSLRFNLLKEYFPNLKGMEEFLKSNAYAGDIDLIIKSNSKQLSVIEVYEALISSFDKLSNHILSIKEEYEGTNNFVEVPLKDFVKDAPRKKNNPDKMGEGISQNAKDVDEEFRLDLSDKDWFVYNDNYGTTEEKRFVKFFSDRIEELEAKYDEVYLIRNERSFHVYSFINGFRFEPDYILIVKKHGDDKFIQQQIFVEPKGGHLIKEDQWKEDFMLQLEAQANAQVYHDDGNDYKVIGLPFFNHEDTTKFKEHFDRLKP